MRCAGLLSIILCVPLAALFGSDADSQQAKVNQTRQEVRDLDALYKKSLDPAERIAAAQALLERYAWLEEAAGLEDARAGQLEALARIEALSKEPALFRGYLSDTTGEPLAEICARRAAESEVPEALQALKARLVFVQVRNTSRRQLEFPGGIFFEKLKNTGELERTPASDKRPAAADSYAKLFALPDKLSPGDDAQVLALLPETLPEPASVGILVRDPESDAPSRRAVRLWFPAAADPDAYRVTKAREAREEAARKERHEQEAEALANQRPAVKPAPKPEVPKLVEEKVPESVGVCQRAGAEDQIQVSLKTGTRFDPEQRFRVRKKNAWVGLVKMHAQAAAPVTVTEDKQVYWATIIDGTREELTEGTLHPEK